MIKHVLLFSLFICLRSFGQCDSVNISGDLIVSSSTLMSGTYVVSGDFVLQSGNTIYITPYSSNSCGKLKIYANNITIDGTIDGNYAGYPGGLGGDGGVLVTSITGHQIALTACTDSGNYGKISVEGGKAGLAGEGPGGGNSGTNGGGGSGPKQYCGSFGDEAGLIGGSGGAGGGSGGSYGGQGSAGGSGGSGTTQSTTNGLSISAAYPVEAGTGGNGGQSVLTYGTASGSDIDLGSGGAGSGGGGRSFNEGVNGNRGGKGGGMIFLKAQTELIVSGALLVNGENGLAGGKGGNGDATTDCCSDGCNGCNESTFSTGAGGGAGSGGGSGGGVYLESLGTASISGVIESRGGNGGNGGNKGNGTTCTYTNTFCSDNSITSGDGSNGAQGGAGGGGRIKIFVPFCSDAEITSDPIMDPGLGFGVAGEGTYEIICGYAGVNEFDLSAFVRVFPNPAENWLNISLKEDLFLQQNKVILEIVNSDGRIMLNETMNTISNQIDLTSLSPGYYIIRLNDGQRYMNTKLIKL
jgi:hypothetical protein